MGCQPNCPEFVNPELREACSGVKEVVVDNAGSDEKRYGCGVVIMRLLQNNPEYRISEGRLVIDLRDPEHVAAEL